MVVDVEPARRFFAREARTAPRASAIPLPGIQIHFEWRPVSGWGARETSDRVVRGPASVAGNAGSGVVDLSCAAEARGGA